MTAQFYRVWCRFEPDFVNAMTGRRGQWRVYRCDESMIPLHEFVASPMSKTLGILSTKPYPSGGIIRPHKELNKVLAARKATA